MPGTEKPAEFYNSAFRNNHRYSDPDPLDAPWAPLWLWASSRIGEQHVVEIGCGPGHLAQILANRGHPSHLYEGFDFSEEAIAQAKRRVPGYVFRRAPISKLPTQGMVEGPLPTVVAIEVLEHINADLAAIRAWPTGTRFLITVPTYDSEGHVRHFPEMWRAVKRYSMALHISSVTAIGRCFAIEGTVEETI